jgi:PAS domain S-box-containing protein
MLGYSKEEMLTKTPFEITTGNFNPPIEKILEDLRTTGTARFETEHRRKDGSTVPVEVNSHVVTIQGKKVLLGVARDITERRRAEKALNESESFNPGSC